MFCNNCGTQLPDNSAFCANCGAAQNVQQAAPQAPAYEAQPQYNQAPVYEAQPQYNQAPVYNAAPEADAGSLLVKGILALALSEFGIPGIILGSMAKKLAAQFMAANGGQIFGKAKVGSILGKIGFGLGIGMTIFWGIYLLFFVIILGLAA